MPLSNKETLLLDMDGVLTDTMGKVMDIVSEEKDINIHHELIEDYWFSGLDVAPSVFKSILRRSGFYMDLEPITGSIRAVNALRTLYNDNVAVCTAPMSKASTCEAEKREWLTNYFDRDFAKRAIVTTDKTTIPGRVLLEDNPDISRQAEWQPVMFDQPWNKNAVDLPRIYNWGHLEPLKIAMNGIQATIKE